MNNRNCGPFNNCEGRLSILENKVVPRRLDNFDEISNTVDDICLNDYVYVDGQGEKDKKIKLSRLIHSDSEGNLFQTDWAETNIESPKYIKNKPGVDNYEDEIIALYTVGGIKAGDHFPANTSLRDIISKMFSFGSESYYYLRQVINTAPSSITEAELINLDRATDSEGRYINHHLISTDKKDSWLIDSLNNQYWFVAIRSDSIYSVKKILQASISLDIKTKEVGHYTIWYADTAATAKDILLQIKFKTDDE